MRATENVIVIALAVAACGAEQQRIAPGPDTVAVIPATRAETRGKHLFLRFCYQCHPGGNGGLGPALDDRPITLATIRTQIRTGTGAMPEFDTSWLSNEQVEAIAEYVTTLQKTTPARTAFR